MIVVEKTIVIFIIISVKCTDHHTPVKEHHKHLKDREKEIAIPYLVVKWQKKFKKISNLEY